jgi:Zn-dependent M28 family amino/carboxypeptidase
MTATARLPRSTALRSTALLAAVLLAACGPAPHPEVAAPAPHPEAAVPAAAAPAAAAPHGDIRERALHGHIRFLAHDLLEGRAPATRGGDLAAEYIAAQYEVLGLRPPAGSWFQPVELVTVTADPASIGLAFAGPAGELRGEYLQDFVTTSGTQRELAEAEGEVVFVGYGIRAPEQEWDDYAGVDVRGRIVMALVNDPGATAAEPDRFSGRTMTYYGRWTYKYEEAERQGAAGILLVHTTESAGYPFTVVQTSWSGDQYELPLTPDRAPLAVQGWVTDEMARRILALGGHDLDALTGAARERGFRAVPTGVRATSTIRSSLRRETSPNVVGMLPGETDEVVVFTAHYDHLGIGRPVDGDSIYSGALDNASGVALMLELARSFARAAEAGDRLRRSLLFVATTAEESGLLGAHHYVRNPVVPLERTVAAFNVDGANIFGRTRDVTPLGHDRSTLGRELDAALATLGMRASPEPFPERGYFFRSDHFPFALAGVPALWLLDGTDYIGRPPGWGRQVQEAYTARHYHQPSDVYREDFDLSGAVQQGQLYYLVARRIANAQGRPEWHATSEFQRPR